MDEVERNTPFTPEGLEQFKEGRRQDYCVLLIREAARPDGYIDPSKLEEVTRREVDAGRMASDDDLRQFAVAAVAVVTPPPEVQKPQSYPEFSDVLKALAAQQKAQNTKPAPLAWLRQKLATARLGVALGKWRASPVGQTLQEYTNYYISDATILGSHSSDYKQRLIVELYESLAAIYGAENPFLQCRQILSTYVDYYADWMVLALKPHEKLALEMDDPRNSPYVSGELHRHIRYCAQYNGELANLTSKDQHMPDEDLIGWANAPSCAYQYLMNGVNMVRADVGDVDLKRKTDWFRPFVKSLLISKEDTYRNKIGLPSLLPNISDLSWRHSSFSTLVMNGHHDPLSQWHVIHELVHREVS